MANKYLYLFPSTDDLKAVFAQDKGRSLGNSHKEGFTPKEDIVLKGGTAYDISLWRSETKNGTPQIQVTIKEKEKADIPF